MEVPNNTMQDRILLIRTGGTIDAEPYPDPHHIPEYIKPLKQQDSLIKATVETLPHHDWVDHLSWVDWEEERFVKDSKNFKPKDIKALADIIRRDDRKNFIITHGTDYMVKNARALQTALRGSGKTVVFIGSMVPLSMQDKVRSDGVASLAHALEHVDEQTQGVYVLGRSNKTQQLEFFDPGSVKKDWESSVRDLDFTLAQHSR